MVRRTSRAGAAVRLGALCLVPVASLACDGAPAAKREATDSALTFAAPVMSQRSDSLSIELAVPAEVRTGEIVTVTMRVRNRGARSVDLALLGRSPTLDVIVTRATGETVWQRLEHEVIPSILALRVLAPGEQLEVTARWDQRGRAGSAVAPGPYLVRGLLLTDGAPLEAPPASLRLLPR